MGNANSTRNSRATLTRCTRSPMDSKLGEVKENVANPNDSITHQIDCHGPTAREQDEEDVTYAYVKVEVTILAKRLHILKDETILVRSVGVKESHVSYFLCGYSYTIDYKHLTVSVRSRNSYI